MKMGNEGGVVEKSVCTHDTHSERGGVGKSVCTRDTHCDMIMLTIIILIMIMKMMIYNNT